MLARILAALFDCRDRQLVRFLGARAMRMTGEDADDRRAEHGGMVDDGTLFRLCQNNFRWIGGDDYGGRWLREQAEKKGC